MYLLLGSLFSSAFARYVVLELVYEDDKTDLSLTTRDLLNALRDIIQTIHGEFGAAQVRHLSGKVVFQKKKPVITSNT